MNEKVKEIWDDFFKSQIDVNLEEKRNKFFKHLQEDDENMSIYDLQKCLTYYIDLVNYYEELIRYKFKKEMEDQNNG